MSAHGMPNADRTQQIERGGQLREILAEISPRIRRRKFRAVPMPAKIQRVTMSARQVRDHLVPTARVEASGMAEHHRRIRARPLPHCKVHSIDGRIPLDGHPLQSIFPPGSSSWKILARHAVSYAKIYCADANS